MAAHRPGDPWQVRIEDGKGEICGAGILLDGTYVLTCAHVVESGLASRLAATLRVRFDRRPELRPCDAFVLREYFSPPDPATGRGDVAVLELRPPVPGQPRTQLRRAWRRRQQVRMFGYPAGVGYGMWVDAKVAGRAIEQSQLVQLNVPADGPQVERGFSGTAVIDEHTSEIIGMIHALDTGAGGVCWMIPVPAISENVPLISRYAFGPSSDPGFDRPRPVPISDVTQAALLDELATWLCSDGPGGICVVAGGPASARDALLGTLIGSGDPGPPAGHMARPSIGQRSIDVAVDAAGKTAEQVSRQLASGLGGGDEPGMNVAELVSDLGTPVAVVVDSIDAADQPATLVGQLLDLVARPPQSPVRLLLGFRGRVPGSLQHLVVANLPDQAGNRPRRVPASRRASPHATASAHDSPKACFTNAAALVEELALAEESARARHVHVSARIMGTPPPAVAAAAALRIRLSVLGAAPGGDEERRLAEIQACERAARDSLAGAHAEKAALDALLSKRDALRRELKTYRRLAVECGFEEDRRLGHYYTAARDILWRAPCDLARAERAVRAYYDAIWRRRKT